MEPAEVIAKCLEHDHNRTWHSTAVCMLSDLRRAGFAIVRVAQVPERDCRCWVGHGGCGGCSGVIGITHEPSCGWELNPDCPVHGGVSGVRDDRWGDQ